jgi:MFS family permease
MMRPAPASALDPRRWWVLALLCGAFFMVILDATIVLVALPSIQADLGFSEQSLQWVLSAYALTFGGLLLLGGRAADLLGRRRLFMTGVLLFTVASLMCGLAWSPAALLAARVAQGVGAAIMTPTPCRSSPRPSSRAPSATRRSGSGARSAASAPPVSATPACRYGAALGVAIVTTVSVSSSDDFLATNEGANPLLALTEGLQSAFLALVVLTGVGVALALLLLGGPRKAPQERLEPVPATGAAD